MHETVPNSGRAVNSEKNERQALIPVSAIPQVPGIKARVLLALYTHRNGKTGRCDPGVPTLCKDTGDYRRSLTRALDDLYGDGVIDRSERPGKSPLYHLPTCRGFAACGEFKNHACSGALPAAESRHPTQPQPAADSRHDKPLTHAADSAGDMPRIRPEPAADSRHEHYEHVINIDDAREENDKENGDRRAKITTKLESLTDDWWLGQIDGLLDANVDLTEQWANAGVDAIPPRTQSIAAFIASAVKEGRQPRSKPRHDTGRNGIPALPPSQERIAAAAWRFMANRVCRDYDVFRRNGFVALISLAEDTSATEVETLLAFADSAACRGTSCERPATLEHLGRVLPELRRRYANGDQSLLQTA